MLENPVDDSIIPVLKRDISEAQADIQRGEAEELTLKEQLEAVKATLAQLAERRAKLGEIETSDVPRQRHAISLYANVSNIRWDYTDEAKVKGYITSSSATGTISSFELDPTSQSENFIVNYLWNKMG